MANGDHEKLGEGREAHPSTVARQREVELASDVREDVKERSKKKRKGLIQKVKDWFKGAWEGVKNFFGASRNAAEKAVEKAAEAGGDALQKGKETVKKVIDGILELPDGLRMSSDLDSDRAHPVTGKKRPHKGIDIAMQIGTPIKWFLNAEATVLKVAYQKGGAGNYINVASEGKVFKFFHLKEQPKLKKGAKVKKGDLLGLSGNTGIGTGAHLHVEVWEGGKVLDPLPYLPKYLQEQVLAKRKGKSDPLWNVA